MKLKLYLSIILLLVGCVSISANDCQSFQARLNIQNKSMEYVSCNINTKKQGVPIELTYRFKGVDAVDVERYLIDKFDINPIERKKAHAFWSSHKSYHPDHNLTISIGTKESFDDTREKWPFIDYFYVQFSEDTDDI